VDDLLTSGFAMSVCVCIPVYNDWSSALLLLPGLDRVAALRGGAFHVLFVDDGSTEPVPTNLGALTAISRVSVLTLRRNLGHQRAIAIGLTHLYENASHDAIVVMDGDGEDDPMHLVELMHQLEQSPSAIVFAQRARRTEGLGFRAGYRGFKLLHYVLTGLRVEVGNFSIIPRPALARLVGVSELWNHYAAAVHHARIATAKIPLPRRARLRGGSKMNLVALINHGLSAISVHGDVVGARLLCFLSVVAALLLVLLIVIVCIRFMTSLAIPGWATTAFGLSFVSLLNLISIGATAALAGLQARTRTTFVPLRDYRYSILSEQCVYESSRDQH
jgi:glycosyltransferase involved in cell wall biosynthesis